MTNGMVIGKDNKLLWHLPADFDWFKEHTMNKPVIMGRNTFESIGKPLPGRKNIVLSRGNFEHDGVIVVETIESALTEACRIDNYQEVFIIGGEQIYKAFLPCADRLYITFVNADIEGDTKFPEWGSDWRITYSKFHKADDKNAHDMRFLIMDKKIGS